MATTFNGRRKVRKSFGSIREVTHMPNLIEVQKASYDQFLLVDEPKAGRPDEGNIEIVFVEDDIAGDPQHGPAMCERNQVSTT